ncbi:(5-formylfuran-3-yl)methyl phosphate synthase [Methylobacterium sp. J-078]|uniref:(5-formylfuran-3-yl)methyl phosphate synthase n=1 Tax=Methylobacterium sp. J-078 TaxID=2836657 RepID=UPI001FBADAAA|nr:(5-formylfuran-3-yl)methyl phosphate synthase [Methylobacterium sp. J-078]MCJ2043352.1 (5-formylfuran-3-yl)methyl phosphate synthase [Methylobacterium sp. J-078]
MSLPRVSRPFDLRSLDGDASAPRLLVSVRDADEAALAARAGTDLVDAKDPDRGALGALPAGTVRAIVALVDGRTLTSAVAGEPDRSSLVPAIADMAETGVDVVKVAVRGDWSEDDLARAAAAASGRLIAVLFAEAGDAPGLVPRLRRAGFFGAMIDTAGKDGRRLTDHLPRPVLAAFTRTCRDHGLVSGLAGSLALADIAELAPLGPHYLGFRGGLCVAGDRRQGLDSSRVAEAVRLIRASARRDAA